MDILEELAKIRDPQQRKREAAELLEQYKDSHLVPLAKRVPEEWSLERLAELLEQEDAFYRAFDGIFGEDAPGVYKRLRQVFAHNRKALLRLAACETPWDMPIRAFPPYAGDWQGEMKLLLQGVGDGYRFKPKLIGKGGFADVYAGSGPNGPAALKLYRPSSLVWPMVREGRDALVEELLSNVIYYRQTLPSPPFVRINHVSNSKRFMIMERFGRSVQQLLETNLEETDFARAIVGYAEALKHLHDRGLVLGDNSWGSLLLDDTGTRLCDYDTVHLEGDDWPPGSLIHQHYASREHVLRMMPTRKSDLEGLALMIDEVYVGSPFRFDEVDTQIEQRFAAHENKQEYDAFRRELLPPNLCEVVAGMISYPRDDSLSADDFIAAARMDYGV